MSPLHDRLHVAFRPNYIYMYKAFTTPSFRGRQLYGAGITKAFQVLIPEGGYKGLVSYVEVDNQPSLKALRRIGFKRVGTSLALGIRRHYIFYSSSGCRGISRVEVC